ncbi:hypothetical protein [Saccharopolyspora sp. ASAGF58]|uniref:hypothetical protein n=1 Tax=Saccharopolyspora sp. ASAGF58 TaxID=2719023 RepID=UPI00143FCE13|nr:hypothetical protein [Saccharopolyspora sp. ASAGF58]QIZ38965.1 hypothetical protein FDZ84_36325 [Saccharopolyspora sp. ASAGF58]
MTAGAGCAVGDIASNAPVRTRFAAVKEERSGMGQFQVAAWVRIEDCSMDYAVFGDEVEFRVGGQLDGIDIVFTETGLERLVTQRERALRELRTNQGDVGE